MAFFQRLAGSTALTATILTATACSSTPSDLHGLPEDDAERATLCGRAAVVYATAAETGNLPTEEQKRRTELLQEIVNETGFFSATGLSEEDGQTQLADVEGTLSDGNWLTTLNNCKAAYELGDAEPIPELPGGATDKAAACGAAALIANLDGKSVTEVETMLEDPQAAYFLTVVASETGGDMAKANAALEEQVTRVVSSGAVGSMMEQCIADFPEAELGRDVVLPKKDDEALVACGYASELIQPDAKLKPRADLLSQKLDAHPANMITAARAAQLEKSLYKTSAKLGTPNDVLKACELRFK